MFIIVANICPFSFFAVIMSTSHNPFACPHVNVNQGVGLMVHFLICETCQGAMTEAEVQDSLLDNSHSL